MAADLSRLIDPNAKVEKIAAGFAFTEGPVFSRLGYLLFSDLRANRIMKWSQGRVTVFRENSNGANGLTFDHQGRLLACEADRVTRTEKDGSITVLAHAYERKALNHPNDLVYSIDGSVYFTDLRSGKDDPDKTGFSAVYQITPQGVLRVVSRDCDRPNGVALARNQQQLYVADSAQWKIWVFDVEGGGGLRNPRIFAELKSDGPDGLKTDESGNVWVAGPGGIWIFNAQGEHVGDVPTPEMPANCGWGDNFVNLYITARSSVYRVPTRVHGTRTY
jgi:gluconolactonase